MHTECRTWGELVAVLYAKSWELKVLDLRITALSTHLRAAYAGEMIVPLGILGLLHAAGICTPVGYQEERDKLRVLENGDKLLRNMDFLLRVYRNGCVSNVDLDVVIRDNVPFSEDYGLLARLIAPAMKGYKIDKPRLQSAVKGYKIDLASYIPTQLSARVAPTFARLRAQGCPDDFAAIEQRRLAAERANKEDEERRKADRLLLVAEHPDGTPHWSASNYARIRRGQPVTNRASKSPRTFLLLGQSR